ncbi:hypothetical protein N7510_007651 [Penicillium lagena]|uniref:uncharacterized protein n=1 Tax=Penicillium lagena TaxID=94218 RepID=UPI0025409565|nr:uncharacterized protein N7510_007651 [Penicillium lagena]KAJ5610932.1 hypothetical protein N7510_007651 [Penicillium lagena]
MPGDMTRPEILALDHSKHIISHATFHGYRFSIFIFDSRGAAFAGHLLEAFTELGVGLGYGFRFGLLLALVL